MNKLRRLGRHEADRHQATGPKGYTAFKALIPDMHLTVAAKTKGAHRDRLDHRAPGAYLCTRRVNRGPTIAQNGDIGGRAANIRYKRMIRSRHPARADNARRWSAQDCLNRAFAGLIGRNKRTIAAHHHQRCLDAKIAKLALGLVDKSRNHPDQPRIQKRRQRPFRPIQARGKVMRTRHRPPGHLTNDRGCGKLVRRVAGRKLRCNSKGRNTMISL